MAESSNCQKEIFLQAIDLASPAEREAFLAQACGSDASLRRQVDAMLQAHGEADSFLEKPAGATLSFDPINERVGTTIGPYKLKEQIGEGGMGLVFVAEQQHPVRRKVALKIIKPGMDTREVIARFEAERQALALMDHPNIARVLDAGATESGRPFFVMELVKGIPIVEYCDQQQLTARERLELFLSVCQAVQHAHSKGIIHRDLKPSNILVAPHDGVPVVKVIDFGVAKAIGQQLTDKSIYTRFTQMIGTPLYMSPEQAEINALDVDIRSDVYSLGVLLYELLTGSTPFDKQRFATAAYDEIRRIIKEEEPPKPSTRLSSLGATLSKVSTQRKTEPAKLAALVKGDLDWIVMKALEKDRNRRYETASAFAADVRRFLGEEPIEARPPSNWYRFRKLARRNKAALTTSAVIAAILVLGTAVSAWQAVEARQAQREADIQRVEAVAAEKRAEAESANAVAALDFITNEVLAQASPDIGADPDIKLRTVVDVIAKNLDQGAKQPPLVEASIRVTVGKIYLNLERYPDALRHFIRAYEIRKSALGERHPDTIRAMVWRAFRFLNEDEDKKAFEPRAFRALTLAKDVLGPRDFHTLIAMRNVASVHDWRNEHQEAEGLRLQFLKDCDETRTQADTWSITARNDLAWHYLSRRMFKESEKYAAEALDLRLKNQGEGHYLTLLAEETLVEVYIRQGRYADVEKRLPRLAEGFRKQIGEGSLSHIYARSNIGWAMNRQGKHEQAVTVYQDLIPLLKKVESTKRTRFQLALALTVHGDSLNKLQRFAEAKNGLQEALRIREKDLGPDHSRTCNTRSTLGETFLGLKQFKEAEEHLKTAYLGQQKEPDSQTEPGRLPFDNLNETLARLVRFYDATGNPTEAARWQKKLDARKETEKK